MSVDISIMGHGRRSPADLLVEDSSQKAAGPPVITVENDLAKRLAKERVRTDLLILSVIGLCAATLISKFKASVVLVRIRL
jgi:hypothetical protein